jgi:hypothetical protein
MNFPVEEIARATAREYGKWVERLKRRRRRIENEAARWPRLGGTSTIGRQNVGIGQRVLSELGVLRMKLSVTQDRRSNKGLEELSMR